MGLRGRGGGRGRMDGVGGGEGGGAREMGVSVRAAERLLNADVCHPAACRGHTGLKLADDPD